MSNFDSKQICSYKDIDRFGFSCDVCGRKVNGCHIVNGMSFCEKCYQETFGKDNQQEEIKQLKQQVEEKDKEIERWKQNTQIQEYDKLLAEKQGIDLAIEKLKEVKMMTEWKFRNIAEVVNFIDQQIKELKGE